MACAGNEPVGLALLGFRSEDSYARGLPDVHGRRVRGYVERIENTAIMLGRRVGVEIFRAIENTELIDFAMRSKRLTLENCAQREGIWNAASDSAS